MTNAAVSSIKTTQETWIGEWDSKYAGVWVDYTLLLVSIFFDRTSRLLQEKWQSICWRINISSELSILSKIWMYVSFTVV